MPKENFSEFENLRSREGVISFMKLSKSLEDWNIRWKKVRKANGDVLPIYWSEAIIDSGLMQQVYDSWKNK